MFKPHLLNNGRWVFLIFLLLIFVWPLPGGAADELISDLDPDDFDPVEFSSRIMEIRYDKEVLVVAEQEVMIIDLTIRGEQLTTMLTNSEGDAILFESLAPGQNVRVQGVKLADGRVVASMVQLLETPRLRRRTVRKIDPVE